MGNASLYASRFCCTRCVLGCCGPKTRRQTPSVSSSARTASRTSSAEESPSSNVEGGRRGRSLREDLSRATLLDGGSSAEEKRKALRMLEDVAGIMRRVLGPAHPDTLHTQSVLKFYRRKFPGA